MAAFKRKKRFREAFAANVNPNVDRMLKALNRFVKVQVLKDMFPEHLQRNVSMREDARCNDSLGRKIDRIAWTHSLHGFARSRR